MFRRPFRPPLHVPDAARPFNFPHQFAPVARQGQGHSRPRTGTIPSPSMTHTGKSLPSSSQATVSTVSEVVSGVSVTKSSSTPIIKDFKIKGAPPRFVPRQLKTAQSAVTSSNKILPPTPDPVIEELKQNAFVLGSKVQGPSLPSETERKRKQFQKSETGSESLDKTVHAIRQKVSQVSATYTRCLLNQLIFP